MKRWILIVSYVLLVLNAGTITALQNDLDTEAARELVRALLTTAQGPQLETTVTAGRLPTIPVHLPLDPAMTIIGGVLETNGGYQRARLFLTSTLSVDEVIAYFQSSLSADEWRDVGAEVGVTLGSTIPNGERLLYCQEAYGYFLHIAVAEVESGVADIYAWVENDSVCGALDPALPTPATDPEYRGAVRVIGDDQAALLELAERIATPIRLGDLTTTASVSELPANLPVPLELPNNLPIIGSITREERFSYDLEVFVDRAAADYTYESFTHLLDEILLANPDWAKQEDRLYCYLDIGFVRLDDMPSAGLARIFVGAGTSNSCTTPRATG